jgi:hypothetical protein
MADHFEANEAGQHKDKKQVDKVGTHGTLSSQSIACHPALKGRGFKPRRKQTKINLAL